LFCILSTLYSINYVSFKDKVIQRTVCYASAARTGSGTRSAATRSRVIVAVSGPRDSVLAVALPGEGGHEDALLPPGRPVGVSPADVRPVAAAGKILASVATGRPISGLEQAFVHYL
jgi:hypothetical protein